MNDVPIRPTRRTTTAVPATAPAQLAGPSLAGATGTVYLGGDVAGGGSTAVVSRFVADGGVGDVRLVTGRYFQDWLLYDTDWNWRLESDQGGALRAVGDIGSHWLDLTSFATGLRVESVMADLTTFIPVRHKPTGPVLTFSTERAAGRTTS